MATNATLTPEVPAPINHFGRIVGALVSPRATFEDIAQRPSWIAPIILLTVVALLTAVVFTQRVGWQRVVKQTIERNPSAAERLAQLTPEHREQAIARNVKIYTVVGYAGGLLQFLVIVVIVAAILMGSVNLLCGASVNYRTSMSLVAHAYIPSAIAAVLTSVILLLKPPDTVDFERVVASNLGAFLASDTPRWLLVLASSVDLFAFWRIGLLALGFSVASPKKVTLGKALAIALVLYALFSLAAAGLAAVFS
jgi:hypothetical protein